MTKTCSKCHEEKDLDLFYKRTPYRSTMDGWDYYCKCCRNEAAYKTLITNKAKCTADGCDRLHYAKNFCKNHYHQLLRRQKKVKK